MHGLSARAWVRRGLQEAVVDHAEAAIAEVGFNSDQGEHLVVVENTPPCTTFGLYMCSCYPWSLLGLPPVWYKSAPYDLERHDPRGVLREFGLELPSNIEVRVWTAPRKCGISCYPSGQAGRSECRRKLAALVTRDSMIFSQCQSPFTFWRRRIKRCARHGGAHGMGPVHHEKDEPAFHESWKAEFMRSRGPYARCGNGMRMRTGTRSNVPPVDYLRMSYYERWLARLESMLVQHGLVTAKRCKAGKPAAGAARATPARPGGHPHGS